MIVELILIELQLRSSRGSCLIVQRKTRIENKKFISIDYSSISCVEEVNVP